MELFLICIAVAYTLTGKYSKETAQSAYKAGKEPPGLAKARMRHEAGGGGWKPGKSGQSKPAGKGGARLVLASKWAQACEKTKDRSDAKHRAWRAWFAEQADQHDQQWRDKQARKIAKSEALADTFARGRGILAHPVETRRDKQEQRAWDENARRDEQGQDGTGDTSGSADSTDGLTEHQRRLVARYKDACHGPREDTGMSLKEWFALPVATRAELALYAQRAGRPGKIDEGKPTIGEGDPEATADIAKYTNPYDPDGEKADAAAWREMDAEEAFDQLPDPDQGQGPEQGQQPTPFGNTNQESGGNTVYQQGAAKLHNHADEVEGYMHALTQLGDEMAGVGWGAEVHGPLADMRQSLQQVAGRYRDLAEQVKQQGDEVNDAYDDAPWAPDRSVLVQ